MRTDLTSKHAVAKLIKMTTIRNLEVAIDVYISRVNGSPCGNTTIQLQKSRLFVNFLKGSKKTKLTLVQKEPEQYSYFKRDWDVCSYHMVSELPQQ